MNLLELRKQMKRKKPSFVRQDAHKKRLKKRWVKPRGLHSKVRLKHRGHARKVSDGYRAPKEVRGLSKEGLKVSIVHNEKELESIDKEKEGIIISSKVSLKNKISLLKKAKEKGIKILNLKNVDEYLKRKEEEIKKRLEKKKVKEEKKKEGKKEEKEEKLEEKLGEEEKKEKEKKEKDKLLSKRES